MEIIIKKIRQFLKLDYPYEVFYDDGSRSWKPEKDKKPWGVFFGNGIISLNDENIHKSYINAVDFLQIVGDKTATCGSKDFWESVAEKGVPELQKLNELIEKLGGQKIEGFYNTMTPHHDSDAFFYYADSERSYVRFGSKFVANKIRAVIEL